MPGNNEISIKFSHNGTFRRFSLDSNKNEWTYEKLLEKVNAVAPNISGQLSWKDEQGDLILFDSDMELLEAIKTVREMATTRSHAILLIIATENDTVENIRHLIMRTYQCRRSIISFSFINRIVQKTIDLIVFVTSKVLNCDDT